MSDFPADDEQVKNGTGRTAAECDERWRASKAVAFMMIAEEAEARARKTARLRALRLRRGFQPASPKSGPRPV